MVLLVIYSNTIVAGYSSQAGPMLVICTYGLTVQNKSLCMNGMRRRSGGEELAERKKN
jgi:hypothetical protein